MTRPQPLTQRDGSALANSNCRPTSIAVGLEWEYGATGQAVSSGKTMRGRMTDQEGGTSSSDAVQAWRTYEADLTVRDGKTWSDAMADLRAGRLVHLDVWHASVGGPCLSGAGSYSHTIAVLPEHDEAGTRWLVCDPWCNPPRWEWVAETKLQAGAEEWGRRVYSTGGPTVRGTYPPRQLLSQDQIDRIVRELMTRWRPDRPAVGRDAATGGSSGGPILYTVTHPGEEVMTDVVVTDPEAMLCELAGGTPILNLDGSSRTSVGSDRAGATFTSPFGTVSAGGTALRAIVWTRAEPDPDLLLATYRNQCQDLRPVDGGTDVAPPTDEAAIRAERDDEWIAHLTPP